MKMSVTFLGRRVNADGLHLQEKVGVLMKAPTPLSFRELKSFLELLFYYSKLLPNLSSVLVSLYHLLRKHVCWKWSQRRSSFSSAPRTYFTSSPLLLGSVSSPCYSLRMNTTSNSKTPSLMLMLMP